LPKGEGDVDDGNGKAGRELLRRFMRCLLRRDASVAQDLGRNAPTHRADCNAAYSVLEDFPKASSFLATARIFRTIEDIYVLGSETTAQYSFKTKRWSDGSAKDIRGAAWNCDGLVRHHLQKDLGAGRDFLQSLEAWLCRFVEQDKGILLSVACSITGGFDLELTSEQSHSIKRGHWVIIEAQYNFPDHGAFQYCFEFNGAEVGTLLAVRVPVDRSGHSEKQVVFDGPWADLTICS
jgi:hypothetical protein